MDKIKVSLTTGSGQQIVSPDDLTEVIPADGLSIDDERIAGIDNFQIDARRAKVTVKLLNKNRAFNDSLKSYLTDPDKLIQTLPDVKEYINCLVFDHERILDLFSEERLFDRHFQGLQQSWDEDATWRMLCVQSPMMLGIIYQCLVLAYHRIAYFESARFSPAGIDKICSMLLKMCVLDTGIEINEDGSNIDEIARTYLNSIFDGYGEIEANGHNILGSLLRYSFFHSMTTSGSSTYSDTITPAIRAFADGLVRNNQYVLWFRMKNSDGQDTYFSKDIIQPTPYGDCIAIALYLSSIIKFDLFKQCQNLYFNFNQDVNNCLIERFSPNVDDSDSEEDSRGTFVPFYRMREVILSRDIHLGNLTPEVMYFGSDSQSPVSACNRFLDTLTIDTYSIPFLKKDFGIPGSGMQVGKTQTRTESEETENGIQVVTVNPENIPSESLFVPVERTFGLRRLTQEQLDDGGLVETFIPNPLLTSTKFKFYIENVKPVQIFADMDSKSILKTGNWNSDTNWMYFDNIFVEERVLGANEDAFVDNIPIFDLETGETTDNYGLYIYREYFTKYFTKEKSSFMDAYLQVMVGNKLMFTGIVDYSTVSITKNSITFDAIDAIGVLVDNIQKIGNVLEFSQFDTGDHITADKRAGTTIGDFLSAIVKNPFPYSTMLKNPDFTIPDDSFGIHNKVINEISAQDAFLMAVQCCKQLLASDTSGKIDFMDVFTGERKIIDGEIISRTESQSIDRDVFDIDKIKTISGYARFAPEIVAYYMAMRELSTKEIQLEVYGQQEEIKILDNIEVDGEMYVVTEKNVVFRSK